MRQHYFKGTLLTKDSIMETRLIFANNCYDNIRLVKEGKIKVYIDHQEYFNNERTRACGYVAGDNDHTLAFLQYAYFIQTGESVPLL